MIRYARNLEYGTQVTNPSRHSGRSGYSPCSGCGKLYTSMGIARHWPKCEVLKNDAEYQERLRKLKADDYRRIVEPGWTALHMIREAIGELFGPLASIESEEAVLLRGPLTTHEAEAIIAALQRVKEGTLCKSK